VRRVIQVERRKLSSRWSFKIRSEVELQGRLQQDVNRVKVLREGKIMYSGKAQAMTVISQRPRGDKASVKSFKVWLQSRKELRCN